MRIATAKIVSGAIHEELKLAIVMGLFKRSVGKDINHLDGRLFYRC